MLSKTIPNRARCRDPRRAEDHLEGVIQLAPGPEMGLNELRVCRGLADIPFPDHGAMNPGASPALGCARRVRFIIDNPVDVDALVE